MIPPKVKSLSDDRKHRLGAHPWRWSAERRDQPVDETLPASPRVPYPFVLDNPNTEVSVP